MAIFQRKIGCRYFFGLTDFIAPLVPLGLGAGRLGNFINGELWGRPTDLPWGMVFPFVDVRRLHLNPLTTLTHREMEVLAAAATGQTTKEIAVAQGVTVNTVKFHLRNVYEKLGVSNRSQAIAIYLKS